MQTETVPPMEQAASNSQRQGLIRDLVADGFRRRMETGTLTPKLISRHFLNSKKPEEIGPLFKCYADAASHEKGSKGPLGNTCRFEKVPACSPYAEQDKNVYVILTANETLTDNGEISCQH